MKPCENGVVNLWNLDKKKIYVGFDKKFTFDMLEIAKNLAGGEYEDSS